MHKILMRQKLFLLFAIVYLILIPKLAISIDDDVDEDYENEQDSLKDDRFSNRAAVTITLFYFRLCQTKSKSESDLNDAMLTIQNCYHQTLRRFSPKYWLTYDDETIAMIDEIDSLIQRNHEIFDRNQCKSLTKAIIACAADGAATADSVTTESDKIKIRKKLKWRKQIDQFFETQLPAIEKRLIVIAIYRVTARTAHDIGRLDHRDQRRRHFIRVLLQCIFGNKWVREHFRPNAETEQRESWSPLSKYLNDVMMIALSDQNKMASNGIAQKPITSSELRQNFVAWKYYIMKEIHLSRWKTLRLENCQKANVEKKFIIDFNKSDDENDDVADNEDDNDCCLQQNRQSKSNLSPPLHVWMREAASKMKIEFYQLNPNYESAITVLFQNLREQISKSSEINQYNAKLHGYGKGSELLWARIAFLCTIMPRFRAKYVARKAVNRAIDERHKYFVQKKSIWQYRSLIDHLLRSRMSIEAFKLFEKFLVEKKLLPSNELISSQSSSIEISKTEKLDDLALDVEWETFRICSIDYDQTISTILAYWDIDRVASDDYLVERLLQSMIDSFENASSINYVMLFDAQAVENLNEFYQRRLMEFMYSIADFELFLIRKSGNILAAYAAEIATKIETTVVIAEPKRKKLIENKSEKNSKEEKDVAKGGERSSFYSAQKPFANQDPEIERQQQRQQKLLEQKKLQQQLLKQQLQQQDQQQHQQRKSSSTTSILSTNKFITNFWELHSRYLVASALATSIFIGFIAVWMVRQNVPIPGGSKIPPKLFFANKSAFDDSTEIEENIWFWSNMHYIAILAFMVLVIAILIIWKYFCPADRALPKSKKTSEQIQNEKKSKQSAPPKREEEKRKKIRKQSSLKIILKTNFAQQIK